MMTTAYMLGDMVNCKTHREYLTYFTKKIKKNNKDSGTILVLNFDLNDLVWDIEKIEVTPETNTGLAKKYLWIGNTPNKTNEYLTTTNIDDLFKSDKSKNPIFLLAKQLRHMNDFQELANLLELIIQQFYSRVNGIDIEKYRNYDKLLSTDANESNLVKKISKIELKSILGGKTKDFLLASIKINGKLISENEDYINYLYTDKMVKDFQDDFTIRKCDICGHKKQVSSHILTKTWIKFFIIDKKYFSTNLSNDFKSNFAICKDCLKKIIIGEQCLINFFTTKWADNKLLIVPTFNLTNPVNFEKLKNDIILINKFLYRSIKPNVDFERFVQEFIEDSGGALLSLDYIFFSERKGGGPNKVKMHIRNVKPSRIIEINRKLQQANIRKNKSEVKPNKDLSLSQIYYCVSPFQENSPKKKKNSPKKKGELTDKYVMNLYNAILSGIPVDRKVLIAKFVNNLKQIYYDNNNQSNYSEIIKRILMMDLCLCFLEDIEVLNTNDLKNKKWRIKMPKNEDLIKIEEFLKDKSLYNHPKARGLFLLGTLISDIGTEQYSKGLENEPILRKINFNGMNNRDLINLFNEIGGKLKDYDIFPIKAEIYEKAISYYTIDTNLSNLSDKENVYYILHGYSYKKSLTFKHRKKQNTTDTENAQTNLDEDHGDNGDNDNDDNT